MPTNILDITHLVQLAMTPAFLLTGIGSLLSVLSGRTSRIVDRQRQVKDIIRRDGGSPEYEGELENLAQRSKTVHLAIYFCSFSGFCICGVVFTIFMSEIFSEHMIGGKLIAWLFAFSMCALTATIALFMREIRLCSRVN